MTKAPGTIPGAFDGLDTPRSLANAGYSTGDISDVVIVDEAPR